MNTQDIIARIDKEKVIAIVRGIAPADVMKVADALYAGGITLMEVPFTAKAPETDEATAQCIADLVKKFEGKMLIGAGTVLKVSQVDLTYNAGGSYIITPSIDVNVIKRAVELGMVAMPGAMTPTEIMTAHNAGAQYVKIFPAGNLGPDYIKAIKAPLNHIKMTCVGGVSEKNFEDFLKVGMVGGGFGGNLANKEWIANGEFEKITNVAKQLVEIASRY